MLKKGEYYDLQDMQYQDSESKCKMQGFTIRAHQQILLID